LVFTPRASYLFLKSKNGLALTSHVEESSGDLSPECPKKSWSRQVSWRLILFLRFRLPREVLYRWDPRIWRVTFSQQKLPSLLFHSHQEIQKKTSDSDKTFDENN